MAELLIVVDSAAKAAFMREYYGGRADCVVCGWPLFLTSHQTASGAPSGMLFHFEGIPGGQEECLSALHAYRNKEVILAFDADAQADYLGWQISGYLSQLSDKAPAVKRLSPTAFNREYVEAALPAAGPVDKQHGLSFHGRLLFDDCLGRHLVRLVGSDRGPGNLPLRYNTLTTLFLLAEREQERSMFPLVRKWQLQATLGSGSSQFTASLSKGLDISADGLLGNETKARSLRDQFGRTPFVVDAVNRSPLTVPAPEPYQLGGLLHDAVALLGLEPATTMAMIQKLFHGVAVDGSHQGVITAASPETKCPSPETIAALRRQVAKLYGESALADYAAPPAGIIIPVRPELSGADLAAGLTSEETALYDLIRNRALTSQMPAATGDTITVDLLAGKEHIFQAHFHELAELGFLQHVPLRMNGLFTPPPQPEIKAGQSFPPSLVECQAATAENQAAERYTIETLLAALADFAIAADPVTVAMLDDLLKAGYATLSPKGALEATDNTAKVVTILNRAFPRMQGINLSAYIEQTISETASNRKDLLFALKQLNQTLLMHGTILVKAKIPSKVQPRARTSSTIIKQAPTAPVAIPREEESPSAAEEISPQAAQAPPALATELPEQPAPEPVQGPAASEPMPAEATMPDEEVAPHDEADEQGSEAEPLPAVEEEQSPAPWPDDLQKAFSEALSAAPPAAEEAVAAAGPDIQPATGSVLPVETAPTAVAEGRRCPVCHKPLLLKSDSFGTFLGCTGFPGCRYSETMTETELAPHCPLCGQGLNRKQTPTGKSFYVCANQECQFMSWSRPHYLPCGLCDSPYLVEKTVRGALELRCPRAGCPYGRPLSETPQAGTAPPPATPATRKVLVRRQASAAGGGGGGTAKKVVRVVRRK